MVSNGEPTLVRGPEDFAAAFEISRETLERLSAYASLLNQWQKTINLVAPGTLPDCWNRHFADSAQLLHLAPPGANRWVDLGSGAGFPGLVVAIMGAKQGLSVTLIESDSRKAAFLREVARQTGVTVDILCVRIESASTHAKVGESEVVSARALAPLGRLLDLAAPFFSNKTIGLFLKGREVEAEIAKAQPRFHFEARLHNSVSDRQGRVAVISQLRRKSEG